MTQCIQWIYFFKYTFYTPVFLSDLIFLLLFKLVLNSGFHPQNCCFLDIFSFSLETLEMAMQENPSRSGFSEILKPVLLVPTIIKAHWNCCHVTSERLKRCKIQKMILKLRFELEEIGKTIQNNYILNHLWKYCCFES